MSAALRQLVLLILFLLAGGAILVGLVLWDDGNVGPLLVAGGAVTIAGAIVSIRRKGRRLREDLLAGKGVISSWHVPQHDLAAFHLLDRERSAADEAYRNLLDIPESAPSQGLRIVIGRDDWLIGGRLYRGNPPMGILLCDVAIREGEPGWIEVAMMSRRSASGWLPVFLRLPVPAGALAAARRTADHLAGRVLPENRRNLDEYLPRHAESLAERSRPMT